MFLLTEIGPHIPAKAEAYDKHEKARAKNVFLFFWRLKRSELLGNLFPRCRSFSTSRGVTVSPGDRAPGGQQNSRCEALIEYSLDHTIAGA